jgi:hypothetical protein
MKKWSMVLPLLLCMVLLVSCSSTSPTIVPDNGFYKFPETREELVKQTPYIVTAKIMKTEIHKMKESNAEDSKESNFYVITAKVEEVLRGDFTSGQEIQIIQEGDNKDTIYEYIIKNGGYLKENTRWLLFLNKDVVLENSYVVSINGQYQLNDKDEITFRTDMSKQYFNEFQTVGEMKKILDTLVLE